VKFYLTWFEKKKTKKQKANSSGVVGFIACVCVSVCVCACVIDWVHMCSPSEAVRLDDLNYRVALSNSEGESDRKYSNMSEKDF